MYIKEIPQKHVAGVILGWNMKESDVQKIKECSRERDNQIKIYKSYISEQGKVICE